MTTTQEYADKAGIEFRPTEPIAPVRVEFLPGSDVFSFPVPRLTPDGTCSVGHDLEEQPYDLRAILRVVTTQDEMQVRELLRELHDLLEGVQQHLSTDWIGIYQVATNAQGHDVLVKLAYQGAFSRAEFPLTPEFAELSNNSTVGLSGRAVVIPSVAAHQGAYYTCDGKVNSEACLPIFDADGTVVGIIDAESFTEGFFTPDRVALLGQLCHQLGPLLPIRSIERQPPTLDRASQGLHRPS